MARVLVVEDDKAAQHLFVVMYKLLGCEVTACLTQAEAERHLAEGNFQIVHLDDNLTRVPLGGPRPHEGSRILAPIAMQRGCKVIGCSGERFDEDGNPLWPRGVTVIQKPISMDQFQSVVWSVIASLG